METQPRTAPTANKRSSAIHINIRRCLLEVVDGPDLGQRIYPLAEYTLVGRSPSCDLVLTDGQASSVHCGLRVSEDRVLLKDHGSTNGTWCGGVQVLEVFLAPSSEFRVGETTLRLEVLTGSEKILRLPCDPSGSLIGAVPAMQELFALMAHLAPHPIPVVVLGETGTGKTVVAEALHRMSPRAGGPFVAVNCATLQPDLVASTLFGHERGAFTGATRSHQGVFQQASGGTLLLDEIAELPEAVQPRLLQALETGRVRPLGAEREVAVDVRLVAATNRSLSQEVMAGRFRQDLYFRLAGMELTVPPLRERLADLPLLSSHFLRELLRARREEGVAQVAAKSLGDEALRKLASHPWPGNVRELRHTLDRALVLSRGPAIEPRDIAFLGWSPPDPTSPGLSFGAEAPAAGRGHAAAPPVDSSFKEFKAGLIEAHEQLYLEALMRRAEGNQVRAARLAGISRSYLRTLLAKYGMTT